MSVKVTINLGRIAALSNSIPQQADRIIEGAARGIEGGAKSGSPVDTGAMRASIAVQNVGKAHRRIGASARYAVFVEMGSRSRAALPFLQPAFQRVAGALAGKLRGIVG